MLYHIVAMARNRVIGKDNKLPWHFSSDLRHFMRRTLGSTVIMGRKTFESIGKPLPGRENFVLSRNPSLMSFPHGSGGNLKDVRSPTKAFGDDQGIQLRFFTSIEEALKNIKTQDAYIIGGADLYRQTMEKVDGIYLTRIDADYEGGVFYPEIPDSFEEIEIEHLQDNPRIDVVFYQRKEQT